MPWMSLLGFDTRSVLVILPLDLLDTAKASVTEKVKRFWISEEVGVDIWLVPLAVPISDRIFVVVFDAFTEHSRRCSFHP